MSTNGLRGVRILAPAPAEYSSILTPEALAFVAHLARCYGKRVDSLLAQREVVQARFDAGVQPDFLPETRHVREGNWKVWDCHHLAVCVACQLQQLLPAATTWIK